MKYEYQAVAGAGLWCRPTTIHKAKADVQKLRSARHPEPNAEVERVLSLENNARRYWRWRNGKWSTRFWDDPTDCDLAKWGLA